MNASALALTELDTALDQLGTRRSQLGGRLNENDDARKLHDNVILQIQTTKATIEDLDLPKAITELQNQSNIVQAIQAAFLQVQPLFSNIFSRL